MRDRGKLVDGDMTDLPFPDASFNLVLACLAIHNLHPDIRRESAIREASRVLRPGGQLAIIAIFGTNAYVLSATSAGLRNVRRSCFIRGIFPRPERSPRPSPTRGITSRKTPARAGTGRTGPGRPAPRTDEQPRGRPAPCPRACGPNTAA